MTYADKQKVNYRRDKLVEHVHTTSTIVCFCSSFPIFASSSVFSRPTSLYRSQNQLRSTSSKPFVTSASSKINLLTTRRYSVLVAAALKLHLTTQQTKTSPWDVIQMEKISLFFSFQWYSQRERNFFEMYMHVEIVINRLKWITFEHTNIEKKKDCQVPFLREKILKKVRKTFTAIAFVIILTPMKSSTCSISSILEAIQMKGTNIINIW